MRTTVDLPDELYRKVKTTAVDRGVSFKFLVREALETAYVQEPAPGRVREKSWVRAMRNPPFTPEEGDRMRAALAESDRVDLEWQAKENGSDHWAQWR